MKNYSAKDVGDFIKHADKKAQPKLKELRKLVKDTFPDAEEKIAWGVPFYRYHGPLVGFTWFKNHVSFGLGISGLTDEERKALEKKGYVTGKKVVQIRYDQDTPVVALKKIMKAQAKINKAKRGGK